MNFKDLYHGDRVKLDDDLGTIQIDWTGDKVVYWDNGNSPQRVHPQWVWLAQLVKVP